MADYHSDSPLCLLIKVCIIIPTSTPNLHPHRLLGKHKWICAFHYASFRDTPFCDSPALRYPPRPPSVLQRPNCIYIYSYSWSSLQNLMLLTFSSRILPHLIFFASVYISLNFAKITIVICGRTTTTVVFVVLRFLLEWQGLQVFGGVSSPNWISDALVDIILTQVYSRRLPWLHSSHPSDCAVVSNSRISWGYYPKALFGCCISTVSISKIQCESFAWTSSFASAILFNLLAINITKDTRFFGEFRKILYRIRLAGGDALTCYGARQHSTRHLPWTAFLCWLFMILPLLKILLTVLVYMTIALSSLPIKEDLLSP